MVAGRHLPLADWRILFNASSPSAIHSSFTVGVAGTPFTRDEARLDPAYVRELRRRVDTSWRSVRFWFRRRPDLPPVTAIASLLVAEGWPRHVVMALVGLPRLRAGRTQFQPWRYVAATAADIAWFAQFQLARLAIRPRGSITESIAAVAPYCGVTRARAAAFIVQGVRLVARLRMMGLTHLLRKRR